MSLTALFVWRNVTTSHLPLESFLSIRDALDEAIICFDPTSTDETIELAYAIADKWPTVRTIEHIWQTPSVMGSAIGEASNFALKFVKTDLVVNVQADECWYPELVQWAIGFKQASHGVGICRFDFLHTRYNAQEVQAGAAYPAAEKMAFVTPQLRFAPDAWRFETDDAVGLCVAPSKEFPIVHLHHFFRDGIVAQLKNNIDLFG